MWLFVCKKNIPVTHGIMEKDTNKKEVLASLGSYIEENMSVSEFLYKIYKTINSNYATAVLAESFPVPNHSQLLGSDCET